MVIHTARCLERDLPANLALGWREHMRVWVPSCFENEVILEWVGENPPALERSL